MIFPSPPAKEPLMIQTVDIKTAPRKFALFFIGLFCAFVVYFYVGGQKEFLGTATVVAAAFTICFFALLFRLLIRPYCFAVYEEGLDIKGLGLCPWRLVIDCAPLVQPRSSLTPLWSIKLSCAENDTLSDLKKLTGAENVIYIKSENVVQIMYDANSLISKIKFADFNVLLKLCIQSAERNNGSLKVSSKTDKGFELIS